MGLCLSQLEFNFKNDKTGLATFSWGVDASVLPELMTSVMMRQTAQKTEIATCASVCLSLSLSLSLALLHVHLRENWAKVSLWIGTRSSLKLAGDGFEWQVHRLWRKRCKGGECYCDREPQTSDSCRGLWIWKRHSPFYKSFLPQNYFGAVIRKKTDVISVIVFWSLFLSSDFVCALIIW